MRRAYFDSHVYDLLIDSSNRRLLEQLINAVRNNECGVYGSLGTIEELGGVAGKDVSRYRELLDCFWNCVRTNILLDRALILQAELTKSNRLAIRESCFSTTFIANKIRPASINADRMRSISQEVHQNNRQATQSMTKSFQETERRIAEVLEQERQAEQGADEQYQQYLQSVSSAEIQGWLDSLRERHQVRGVRFQRTPCTAALIAWLIARVKMNLRDAKQYERSADHDRDHFVLATQPGTLVTNDKILANTIRMIDAPLANVESTATFSDWILAVK